MKTSFLRTLAQFCFVFILSTLIISCNETDSLTDTTNNGRSFKTAARSITAPNATATNPNSLNHSSELLQDLCFEFVYPIQVNDGTQNITVNSNQELGTYLDGLASGTDPVFVFPLDIKWDDEVETLQNMEQLEEAFEDCFEDFEDCFTLNYPLTVTDGNGNNVEVNNEDELVSFYLGLDDTAEPNFVYPISVTMVEDGSTVTINNDEEFDEILEDCFDFEDCDFDDFDCFEIQYPITATSAATGEITINNDDELDDYFDQLGDNEEPQITFPIVIVFEDNTEKTINTLEELEEEYDECYDDEYEIDDCFTFAYPLTLIKEDNTTVTVNSDDEFDTFIDGLGDDEEFDFQYPFSVLLENGQTQTVNNEDEFFDLFDNCGD